MRVSPDSAVLYRELAGVERRAGFSPEADAHLGRALELDPQDRATHDPAGGDARGSRRLRRRHRQLRGGAEARAVGRRRGPSGARARARRPGAAARAVPGAVDASRKPTRADLAAALALRVPGSAGAGAVAATPVITDLRGHWARPWIVATLRAGVLDAYPEPHVSARRPGAARRARAGRPQDARICWPPGRSARRAVAARHAGVRRCAAARIRPIAAVAQATAAGVLDAAGGEFAPTRPVSGQEVLEAVSRLQRLAGPLAGRDRR